MPSPETKEINQEQSVESLDLEKTGPSLPSDVEARLCWNQLKVTNQSIVLFVTYDPEAKIQPYVRYYLELIKKNGYQIFLIQQSDCSPYEVEIQKEINSNLIDAYLIRHNIGYDFSGWAHALTKVPDLWNSANLIFCNDSVIGPLNGLALKFILSSIDRSRAPVVGLTECYQFQHHIQSYFFSLRNVEMYGAIYRGFWDQIRNYQHINDVIIKYEVNQLKFYKEAGLTHEILFPIQQYLNSPILQNATIELWRQLIDMGFPFLKLKVVRNFAEKKEWMGMIERTKYPIENINNLIEDRTRINKKYISLQNKKQKIKNQSFFRDLEQQIRKLRRRYLNRSSDAIYMPLKFVSEKEQVSLTGITVAVIIHLYYMDTVEEIFQHLSNIPVEYDLFISTDTIEKKEFIENYARNKSVAIKEVRLSQNRGRDIAPKYITFSDVYLRYEYFLHFHGKKSIHLNEEGGLWFKFLLKTLLGSRETVTSILCILADPRVGIVYPTSMSYTEPHKRWGLNRYIAEQFFAKMKIQLLSWGNLYYPSGSMYWGRSAAIRPLLDLHLKYDDFAEEYGQLDGTLAHVIERSTCIIAKKAGYTSIEIAPNHHSIRDIMFKRVKTQQNLNRYIVKTGEKLNEYVAE